MSVLKGINQNTQGKPLEGFLPPPLQVVSSNVAAVKLPEKLNSGEETNWKILAAQNERQRQEQLGFIGRLYERTLVQAGILTCNCLEVLSLAGLSVYSGIVRLTGGSASATLDPGNTYIQKVANRYCPNGSILNDDKQLISGTSNQSVLSIVKLAFQVATYPTTLVINVVLGTLSTVFEEIDRKRYKNLGYAEYLKQIEENPSAVRDGLNLAAFFLLSVITVGKGQVPLPMAIRSQRVILTMLSSLGMGTAGALGEQLMRVEDAEKGGFRTRVLISDSIQGALSSSIFGCGMSKFKGRLFREVADFSDGGSDLFDASCEYERVELGNGKLSNEAKWARGFGLVFKLGTAAYDMKDTSVLAKINREHSSKEIVSDLKGKAINDFAELLALNPKALEDFRISISKLSSDLLSNNTTEYINSLPIEQTTELICLLAKNLKGLNSELVQACKEYCTALLLQENFEDVKKLELALNYSEVEKSQIFKEYCHKEIKKLKASFLSSSNIRGLLLAVGLAIGNKRIFDDLAEVSLSLHAANKMDKKTYYILERDEKNDVLNAIVSYTQLENVSWPKLDLVILDALNLFEVEDLERRNEIIEKSREIYFARIQKDRMETAASLILSSLMNKGEISTELRSIFANRVLECFDVANLAIVENFSPELRCQKTASGHFIMLAAIISFNDAFSNSPNIQGVAEIFRKILSELKPEEKNQIASGLARIMVCCEDGVNYAENIVSLLGLAGSDIVNSAIEEAVLCCYDLERDKTIPVKFVENLPFNLRTADIGFYGKRVRDIFNSKKLGSTDFIFTEEARAYAYLSGLMNIVEIADIAEHILPFVVDDRIGFAWDLTQEYLAANQSFLAEQTTMLFDQSSWPIKDNFSLFHERLIKVSYRMAVQERNIAFQKLFFEILLPNPRQLRVLLKKVLNMALEETFNFSIRFKKVLKCLKDFADKSSDEKFVLEEIDSCLKESLCSRILADDDNPFFPYNVMRAYQSVFSVEDMENLLEDTLIKLADSIKPDLDGLGGFSGEELVKLRDKVIKICLRFGLSEDFKHKIAKRLEY